ncbi:MAG TPA: hypothetical protein IAC41_12040 [Candidatus Merdenecus merdavium]|nr:hypothetical protein [Candidatus Merdenecus merdavium]
MSNKIFSKLTKERRKEFQIETSIIDGPEGRKVMKAPITLEAKEHIRNIYENYIYYKKHGIDTLIDCEFYDDHVVFKFLEGQSIGAKLLAAIERRDKKEYEHLLGIYKDLVYSTIMEPERFYSSTEFLEIFGDYKELEGKHAAKYLNVDMSFDNIIFNEDEKWNIIDYEWIMKFSIPVDFIIYRGIFGFYNKFGKIMADFVSIDDMFHYVDISKEDQVIYRNMDRDFVSYVNGLGDSYGNILNRYKKDIYYLEEQRKEQGLILQFFVDDGNGYHEDRAINYQIGKEEDEIAVSLDLSKFQDIKSIRIDPLNDSCIISLSSLLLYDEKNEVLNIWRDHPDYCKHNAITMEDNLMMFHHKDPHIIIDRGWDKKFKKIQLTFTLIQRGSSGVEEGMALIGNQFLKIKEEFNDLKEQYGVILEIKHELEKSLNTLVNQQSLMKIKINEAQVPTQSTSAEDAQLRVENEYIKSTKAYKLFIEKKVNKYVYGR